MFRIAISGKANSGKNTLASIISEELAGGVENVTSYCFAHPMKEIVLQMFPMATREELFGPSSLRSNIIPGTNITYRQALLDIGKLGRSYDPLIWVKNFQKHYTLTTSTPSMHQAYIISDLRFVNEFETLKDMQFITFRIIRDSYTKINDVSELEQDQIKNQEFDYVIYNDSGLDDLKAKVSEISREIIKKRQ